MTRWTVLRAALAIGCVALPLSSCGKPSPPAASGSEVASLGDPDPQPLSRITLAGCGIDSSGGAIREVPSRDCLDQAARAPLSAAFPGATTIGLDVVVAKRDGTPVVDRARVENELALANRVFASGDISFVINSFTTSDSIPPDVGDDVRSDSMFALRNKLPVLYVSTFSRGGGVAWSNGSGVVVATNGANAILAHELAHALGLGHTYDADDFVEDTPHDPWACEFRRECLVGACDQCAYSRCDPPYENAHPDPTNVMGPVPYPRAEPRMWQQCNLRLTPGQWELIHCTLRTTQRRLVECALCGPGFVCENDTCQCHKTLCGKQCVSLGTTRNCTACGDACEAGSKCLGVTQGCSTEGPCHPTSRDCGLDCNGNQVCIPRNNPGGCPNFVCD